MDERYLDQLFECVVLTVTTEAAGAPRWVNTMTPLLDTIQMIGGQDALKRFDSLIENTDDPSLLFLRLRREKIAEAELARLGEESVEEAAESLGLPLLR